MKKTRLALTVMLAAFTHAALATDLCQPVAASSASKAMLAAAQRHLGDQPNPLPHLHTEGTLPNHGIREQSIAAEKD
ncbi:hypothetical protein Q6305_28710, partial [Klebsiella pneumoniae]|nr:hypothetical protein [Klebsiella pneumoniae]